MKRDEFRRDEKTVFAVCYAFVRLGEAVAHIPPEVMRANPEVEWGQIRHFRNFMCTRLLIRGGSLTRRNLICRR
jgi:uncharacterized protein with HEPN domain